MQSFDFSTEVCLGFHCSGCGEYVDAEGSFTLEDEDVNALVQLIRDHNGETDIEALDLENALPNVYETIREAYRDAVAEATMNFWILNGYLNGAFEENDGIMDALEEEGLFKFEPDLDAIRENLGLDEDDEISDDDIEEAKEQAFEEWKDEYFDSLSEDDQISFIESYYCVDVDNSTDDYEITLEIPQEIVELAPKED